MIVITIIMEIWSLHPVYVLNHSPMADDTRSVCVSVCNMSYEDLHQCWEDIQLAIQDKKEAGPRQVTLDDLVKDGLGEDRTFTGYVLKQHIDSGESIVGFALVICLFSTWAGPFYSVDDFLVFTKDQSLEDYFISYFIKMAQEDSRPKIDFRVLKNAIDSSRVVNIGAEPNLQWFTVRYATPTLRELATTRNETVHSKYLIRKATLDDMETVLYYIQLMAETFNEPDRLTNTVQDLKKWYGKLFECFVAETKSPLTKPSITVGNTNNSCNKTSSMPRNPAIKGVSIYQMVFCRRAGRVVHLEDLIVEPQFRSEGIGSELIKETAKAGLDHNCTEMDLEVLDVNHRAASLYCRLGGTLDNEYVLTRINSKDYEKAYATINL